MTIEEIMRSTKEMLTPSDVAEVLGCDKYTINVQVAEDITNGVNSLGFPVIKLGNRVRIPRRAFLKFITGKEDNYGA